MVKISKLTSSTLRVNRMRLPSGDQPGRLSYPVVSVLISAGFDIEDTKPVIVLAPHAIDDFLSVRGIARKPRMNLTVGQRLQTAAVAPNAHDRGFLSVALLEPVADAEGEPLAIGRPRRLEGSAKAHSKPPRIVAMFGGIVDDAAPRAVRLRDHDRGVALLLFGVGERPVRCQCRENIGVAILPIPIPAVERFVLGARLEVMLFVDQRVAVGRPCGRAHAPF